MKYKILVVEDEKERFRDTQEHLNQIPDLDIIQALSVDGALRRLKTNTFNLVILDIHLGDYSERGNELLPLLKRDPALRNIPVIALSAVLNVNDEDIRQLCMNNGAKAFFYRNSDEFRKEFVSKVRDLLENYANAK